ncbi:phosphoinositide 3-kinase regulatory subunit 5 isoform X3 [Anguilla anguilla]|uniref:phosphoinositide 3-kinase regulatory subunit 5 isoform X3 n=1 Tax=Anguilla anguilla TaxID=7936 RepID=UPI0015B211AE|nr:phosphoinositide 3-kinase regulatory subunit 5 isoform X3 [Anguilla anguilla]XP_035262180.1 phosphoinositide 3-kinase regulatory subunit 5 isoform X3 [Anguilla anguilla]
MQHTSCTEDRIHHALARCLDGLSLGPVPTPSWHVGLCMNRWSLEELVKRDPENFLILLQEILRKTREAQEQCQYELVAPLTLMFSSTLLQTPHFPPDCTIVTEACEVFHCFLTWPEPYCSLSKDLLCTLHQELRAPGISYHRLVREEQGLTTANHRSKTMTVLLMNPIDVPPEFLSVSEQLSGIRYSQKETHVTLIKHAYQSALGTKYPLQSMHKALQSKCAEEVGQIFSAVTEALETAASTEDAHKAREHLLQGLEGLRRRIGVPVSNGNKSDAGMLQTLLLPTAKCYMYEWDRDSFDILHNILEHEHGLGSSQMTPGRPELDDEEEDEVEEEEEKEEDEEDSMEEIGVTGNGYADHRASTLSTVSTFSTASKDSMFSIFSVASSCSGPSVLSVASGVDSDFFEDMEDSPPERVSKSKARLSNRFSMLWARSTNTLIRAKSLGSPEGKDRMVVRSKRSNSLPQQVQLGALEQQQPLRHVCFRRRPILSCEEDGKAATLRVVVFGADHVAGKVARAYSNLRLQESACPRLTRVFKLEFFFIPVRRGSGCPAAPGPASPSTSPLRGTANTEPSALCSEDSTNDIARFIGILDPWYERNMLSLLNLPVGVLCQVRRQLLPQTSKIEAESCDSASDRLPILADLVLYYCRYAARPVLVQLYQAELTLAGGERRNEVFIHSLELGHTAGTRAIKAMGAASKRFGIDGDREAVPLSLEVLYNKVGVSGRSKWSKTEKVCTSITLTKACRKPEELDSKMEYLTMMMTEVLKRQNSKSKKGYNQQLSTMEVKVDKVQVSGAGSTTFAVCLDQDEKKIFQSVTRCDVTVCYKPDSTADWRLRKILAAQSQPLHPTFCSLLCLPIATFSGAQP